jgi:hypothetical protein
MASDHYITRAYLDKFILHPDLNQKVLYLYERGISGFKSKGPKKLGCADGFFDQIDSQTGRVTNMLDETRQKSEAVLFASGSNPSSIFKCIRDDRFMPTRSDCIQFAAAAALLYCSSPVQIHNSAMLSLAIKQQELLKALRSEEVATYYQTFRGDGPTLEEMKESVLKGTLRLDVGEKNWRKLGFGSFELEVLVYIDLLQMGFTICTCHYKSFFLTSDNPVVCTSASKPESPGTLLPDAEIWFPISYKRGLLWCRKHRGVQHTTFGHSDTCKMNKRIIRWCYKGVYSPLPENWIETAMMANTFNPCLGHYGSLEKTHGHKTEIVKDDGTKEEVVDVLAALRAGEKRNVVGF